MKFLEVPTKENNHNKYKFTANVLVALTAGLFSEKIINELSCYE